MHVEEQNWTPAAGWRSPGLPTQPLAAAGLVIYFGNREALRCGTRYAELRAAYPDAHIIGGTATATILGGELEQNQIVATVLSFAHTRVRVAQCVGVADAGSQEAGRMIGRMLAAPDLAGIFVLGDGLSVNGTCLAAGLNDTVAGTCPIAGGMSSDTGDYTEAWAGADAQPASGVVAAVGFYGKNIRLSSGHACGWDAFGPRRRITKSTGNILYELDGKPAVELYERYLGDDIAGGTGAGVIFPLLISPPDHPEQGVVRAILHLDPAAKSMTFAGDMPEGWMARLMRGNVDRLAMAAAEAARQVKAGQPATAIGDRLALMVSCTGRFLLMGQRTVDELVFVRDELGSEVHCLGFYSHGEIAAAGDAATAGLHNQTMTIVGLTEFES